MPSHLSHDIYEHLSSLHVLKFLILNDYVLINYHFLPIVISYFRNFWYFTQLGWLYKPPYDFCNPNF